MLSFATLLTLTREVWRRAGDGARDRIRHLDLTGRDKAYDSRLARPPLDRVVAVGEVEPPRLERGRDSVPVLRLGRDDLDASLRRRDERPARLASEQQGDGLVIGDAGEWLLRA